MLRRGVFVCFLLGILSVLPLVLLAPQPVVAAAADSYVTRYLKVSEPVALELDAQGNTRLFSVENFSAGKRLFEQNCLNCHVGGATLPDPTIALSQKQFNSQNYPRPSPELSEQPESQKQPNFQFQPAASSFPALGDTKNCPHCRHKSSVVSDTTPNY